MGTWKWEGEWEGVRVSVGGKVGQSGIVSTYKCDYGDERGVRLHKGVDRKAGCQTGWTSRRKAQSEAEKGTVNQNGRLMKVDARVEENI